MLGELGLDVNSPDSYGDTPLHFAVLNNRIHSVNFLLSLGAEVEVCNVDGDTPLHTSVRAVNIRSCKDLLLKGASRKTHNKLG
jgi:ankyrin repeat protein